MMGRICVCVCVAGAQDPVKLTQNVVQFIEKLCCGVADDDDDDNDVYDIEGVWISGYLSRLNNG